MKRKSQCWLKGAVSAPRYGEGMISGLKKMTTFAPTSIISLEMKFSTSVAERPGGARSI
ncbi:hypothetical protein NKJ51_23820 [Mesorhizobium sp. M0134]